jgi:hypothetical protein
MEEENDNHNQITWLDKLLLKFWPKLEMRRLAKQMKIDKVVFDKLHEVFSGIKTIDLFPVCGNERGFILVLDRQTALFFYQDGDHFKYDGFEMGKYVKGEVTIFDDLAKRDLSPYPEEDKK